MYGVVLQVPGRVHLEITRAPILPPPGPTMPGIGELVLALSPQQAVASDCGPSDSSAVITSTPSCLNAGEARMIGT